ncbi:hypothetical protein [Aureimonas leprariae]|uniref:DUF4282 domain-containing protein n=1 Tax=Plantimonas leprariae TaxID=2615207 RepID=A0A7V7PMA0_9HYPH|nr:hypothetical protein [Aureimonas leprariae]KAB0677771.1 hypothetical protein F6X38_17480 [Aureimonas leprariae]
MTSFQRLVRFLLWFVLFGSIFTAVLGAFVAAFGGILGMDGLRSAGAFVAGGSAATFFFVILSPLGEIVVGFLMAADSTAKKKSADARR